MDTIRWMDQNSVYDNNRNRMVFKERSVYCINYYYTIILIYNIIRDRYGTNKNKKRRMKYKL